MERKQKTWFKSIAKVVRPRLASLATILLIVALLSVGVFRFVRMTKSHADKMMVEQVAKLDSIFKRINDRCEIIGFEHKKNYVDFLTVVTFVGSEVGAMNLAHPKNWEGPYVNDNPTMQQQLYQVVKTNKGYFITPGEGVRLSNGRTIGKDVLIEESSDIAAMASDDGPLTFRGKALALPLKVRG